MDVFCWVACEGEERISGVLWLGAKKEGKMRGGKVGGKRGRGKGGKGKEEDKSE